MKNFFLLTVLVCVLSLLLSCLERDSNILILEQNYQITPEFVQYWMNGKAEITSYNLEQARYGEIRHGKAVMIFVTEPFSVSKQVKLDEPNKAKNDRVDVLKLNFCKNFNTGIYPYSLETSVFTPIESNKVLKISTSCQEWCGHTFTQLNKSKKGYDFRQFSYFESEGDIETSFKDIYLEDEIWNTIRIEPKNLPLGEIELFPSTQYLRMLHESPKAYKAITSLRVEDSLSVYSIQYPHNQRNISIYFKNKFPYTIEKWTETYKDGWGDKAKILETKATLLNRIQVPYWQLNSNSDSTWRKNLGL
jgi:hypothetical protein